MIWVPSRSGRIAASSSCSGSRAIRSSRSSYACAQRRGLALVAGRAVGAGQRVQPVEQRHRRRGRSGARPSRSTPRCRSRGSAGAARRAGDTSSMTSLLKRSACIRLRVSFAPTTSWWWKLTPPPSSKRRVFGLPTSCISAAKRSTKSGPRRLLEVDGLLEHREGVLVDVLVPVVLVDLELSRGSSGSTWSASPVSTSSASPARGSRRRSSLTSSSRTRSARDDRDPLGHRRHRRDDLGGDVEAELGGEPRGPHHPQRVVGEGRPPGSPGVRRTPRREVVQPVVRVDERRAGQAYGHRVDREVAADQVALERVAVRHLGLARGRGRRTPRGRS